MADDALRALICLIGGESSAFIEKGINATGHAVLAKDLTLWKNLIGKNVPGSMKLEEDFDNISAHWPATTPLNPQHLHIIVELPPDPSMSPLLSETHSAETCDLWPVVTIEATAEGDFGGPDALERNQIFELHGTEPDFLVEFRTKLRQRRWIESDTNSVVRVLKDELHEFDNYFEDAPTDVGQRDRISGKDELIHLTSTLFHKGWKGANVIKEESIWGDFAATVEVLIMHNLVMH
ncbi:hypothetical protein BJV78DRAFT_1289046 [Lactifluus subvellereus]|nr:hypothetical protein BJV78DRAFT_1289046 [Lactifluus subvellereus]